MCTAVYTLFWRVFQRCMGLRSRPRWGNSQRSPIPPLAGAPGPLPQPPQGAAPSTGPLFRCPLTGSLTATPFNFSAPPREKKLSAALVSALSRDTCLQHLSVNTPERRNRQRGFFHPSTGFRHLVDLNHCTKQVVHFISSQTTVLDANHDIISSGH